MGWKERISVDEVGCSGVADVLFIDNVAVSLTEQIVEFIEIEKQKSFEEGVKVGANGLLQSNSQFVLDQRKQAKIEVLKQLLELADSHNGFEETEYRTVYRSDLTDLISELEKE